MHCVRRFEERFDELAQSLCIEAGKPIRDSRGEVTRLVDTFRVAAEESVRVGGDVLNLEISPRARGYRGMTQHVPIGPCSFISPFNFPLNLTAHKIAPAIATGCPFVLKPASRTPVGALLIGEVLAETDLPREAFSILPASRKAAQALTTDDRLKLLSFTGSPAVGWAMKARAGKKKVVLELGGNAACIVDYGLQAGVFTRDLYRMQRAWDELEVGGVLIGDVPSWRVDNMPYGGVKDSGLGREGVRYAMEDMLEVRLLAIRTP
ncbi:MAG: acyl-CoA reductase-like NAD-dependent aldehyde dehydrogenase [Candidatus Paceibacteria bacterium]|jgi:acyl-CoA reductase-like NAD-dependent aldehyde dehydrogenase